MSDESDIDIKSAPKKKKKMNKPSVTYPTEDKIKKLTTKLMITDALTELHTRKGVSVYAIKKYLTEKHQVNNDKFNFLVNKTLKTGVEDGTFVQLKGIGASGSFKLAPKIILKSNMKKETEKKSGEEMPKKKVKISETIKKTEKTEIPKIKNVSDQPKIIKAAKKMKEKEKSVEEKKKKSKMPAVEEKQKKSKVKVMKAKEGQSPTKKKAKSTLIRRKSSGSLLKPPKMKPKKK